MTEPNKEYLQPSESPKFNDAIEGVAPRAVDHPTTWNVPYFQLIENDHWLREKVQAVTDQVLEIVGSDPVSLSDQLEALVQYGAQQVFTERTSNTESFNVVSAVSGDDSIDMESTVGIKENQHYYLNDAGNVQSVRVKKVLSAQRVVLTQQLLSTVATGATLSRKSPTSYFSPQLTNTERGAMLHAIGGALQVKQFTGSSWQTLPRRANGGYDIPAGTEWVSVAGELERVAIVSDLPIGVTRRPKNVTPSESAQGQTTTPILTGGAYYPLYGVPQAKRQFQVITNGGDFSAPLYEAEETPLEQVPRLKHTITTALDISQQFAWRYRDQNEEGEFSVWSTPTTFGTAATYVAAPTINSPVAAAIDVPEQPVIELSDFAVTGGTDTHTGTSVRIKNAAGMVVWEQLNSPTLDKITVPAGIIQQGGIQYTIEGQHHGQTYGESAWSEPSSFTSALSFIPSGSDIGAPYGGGYVMGEIISDYDGERYLLIVSDGGGDSSQKDGTTHLWRNANTAVTNTPSKPPMTLADGRANHNALIAAGITLFPAAKWVEDNCNAGGGLNGHKDWYLPSRDELELIYRNAKPGTTENSTSARYNSGFGGDGAVYGTNASAQPTNEGYTVGSPGQTAADSFKEGGADALAAEYYWSSTEVDANNTSLQNFRNGEQAVTIRTSSRRVRAVRRVKL
ncbi:DUF1566 domain-containing protein [Motilimonas sp. 1_MG-2023]|uniref:DUF1566 domain-containing protein n=1 Tax=Motilimonas sp. 1_MG-2023 TaxID=3062672 RepID=UPI0026E39E41|nr:DUF1566 domain-containing protein [Motilimonas sp. 1_MG-2023]MDO6525434.1 DUF1566 domain-containing protein [Motilimonas sp. 1_MG-2023]